MSRRPPGPLHGQRPGDAHGAALVTGRVDEPFASVDDLWRRAGVPVAALTHIAEAHGFRPSLGLARREALWAIKALGDEPLPLFAAASSRDEIVPEVDEPIVALRAMTAGREVVEDYGHVGLSLRGHPVAFHLQRIRAVRSGSVLTHHPTRFFNHGEDL